jgi:hypothetical protein
MKYLDWQKLVDLAQMWEKGYLNSLETLFEEFASGTNTTDKEPSKLVKWSRIVALYKGTKVEASIEEQILIRQLREVTTFMSMFSVDVRLKSLKEMKNPPMTLFQLNNKAFGCPYIGGELVEITDPSGQSKLRLSFYVYDVDGKGEMTLLPADLIDKDCLKHNKVLLFAYEFVTLWIEPLLSGGFLLCTGLIFLVNNLR